MKWRLPVLLFVLVGCEGPTVPTEGGGGAILLEAHPEAMRTPGWLEFADLSLRATGDGKDPRGPHLAGWILGGLFEPVGNVVGVVESAPVGRVLTLGYLELRTRAFVKKDSASAPEVPYVEGWQDTETGGFYPTSQVRRASVPMPKNVDQTADGS